jgi:hypothetical protein
VTRGIEWGRIWWKHEDPENLQIPAMVCWIM